LKRIDQHEELIEPDNSLELKACTVIMRPNKMRFDLPDHRQAYGQPHATAKLRFTSCHKSLSRDIYDMQMDVVVLTMLCDELVIERMAHCTTLIGCGELCA